MDQFHIFVSGGTGGLLQIQFKTYRNTKDIDPCPLTPGNEGLIDLFRILSERGSGPHSAQIIFVIVKPGFPAGETGLFHQTNGIGFSGHLHHRVPLYDIFPSIATGIFFKFPVML